MPSDQTRLALYDIRDNGKLAQDFVAGLSFERFRHDRLFFYAVTRALEIISEAARRLPTELRDLIRNYRGVRSWASAMSTGTTMTLSLRNTFSAPCTRVCLHCWL
jgi:uncharacterized protein with HEPN domain